MILKNNFYYLRHLVGLILTVLVIRSLINSDEKNDLNQDDNSTEPTVKEPKLVRLVLQELKIH